MNKPIVTLQANASGFFDKIMLKYPREMICKEKCSKCCFVDLSVFQVEADRIFEWFVSLPESEKNELAGKWKRPVIEGENAKGEKNQSCVFLKDDSCTIYEARPLICRTQGAPLFFDESKLLDVCPLNFKDVELPPREDWLNVDRMNMLLTLAQGKDTTRISLKKLQKKMLLGEG